MGFLNRPKYPGLGCFLNPAPAEFLTIAACSRNMFRSRDFCVHSFKHSNIVYNFGASGSHYLYAVYLNIFEFLLALSISRSHALCVKGAHLTRSDGVNEQQILQHGLVSHLSLFSTCDQSNLTPSSLVGCRVAKSTFFPQNWDTFKLLPWVDFSKWVKGLKYCINYI